MDEFLETMSEKFTVYHYDIGEPSIVVDGQEYDSVMEFYHLFSREEEYLGEEKS